MLIPWFQREVSIEECMGPDGGNAFEARLVDPAAEKPRTEDVPEGDHRLGSRGARQIERARAAHHPKPVRPARGVTKARSTRSPLALNLSRERVRQLEQAAKFKLRKYLSRCFPDPLPA